MIEKKFTTEIFRIKFMWNDILWHQLRSRRQAVYAIRESEKKQKTDSTS